jgi:amidase
MTRVKLHARVAHTVKPFSGNGDNFSAIDLAFPLDYAGARIDMPYKRTGNCRQADSISISRLAGVHDPYTSATTLVNALRNGEMTPGDLLQATRERIDRFNPVLNAVISVDADAAPAVPSGPLWGLPVTVKEHLEMAGTPCTAGDPARKGEMSAADGLPVARLRAAGAVLVGKTNQPTYGLDWQTHNPIYGLTRNPWDTKLTPGGSSGGGATAVAAGLVPLDLGGDTAGSVRVPAAFCGVYGHRPSDGLVPRTGGGTALPNPTRPLLTFGPLARTPADLELALSVLAGPAHGEEVAWRLELPPARGRRLADLRVAVLDLPPWLPVAAELRAAVDAVAGAVAAAGARVARLTPDLPGGLDGLHETFLRVMAGRASAGADPAFVARLRRDGDRWDAAWADGLAASAADYIAFHRRRAEHQEAFRAFFRDWDVLLAPVAAVPPFPHDERLTGDWFGMLPVDGTPARYVWSFFFLAALASLAGLPATAFPAGRTAGGLPLGLQAIGPYLEDHTVTGFCSLLAAEIGGFVPPPLPR